MDERNKAISVEREFSKAKETPALMPCLMRLSQRFNGFLRYF